MERSKIKDLWDSMSILTKVEGQQQRILDFNTFEAIIEYLENHFRKQFMKEEDIWDAILLKKVLDNIGMYPKSTIDKEGNKKERTEFQDGHNKAILEITKDAIELDGWYNKLNNIEQDVIKKFILMDEFQFFFTDDGIKFCVLVNDTFYYSTADCEEIEPHELTKVRDLYDKYGYNGVIAWVAHKRGEDILEQLENEKYLTALKELYEND